MSSITAKVLCCLLAVASISVGGVAQAQTDADVLNFALNLEYLEANFYSCAATGKPINSSLWGTNGIAPTGCKKALLSPSAQALAMDIYEDELAHVKFLRAALTAAGATPVDQPALNIGSAFGDAANAAFNTVLPVTFDAYGDDVLFYHAAFIFEDVGVTAYHGAINLVSSPYRSATAGLLGTEAYHAGAIRTLLINMASEFVFPYGVPVSTIVQAISNLRAAVSGAADDMGIINSVTKANILVPATADALPFSRTPAQVLAIVYLGGSGKGGFFPMGMNGNVK